MPVTMEQVREKLEPIEPGYIEATMFGPDAMPFLEQLANGGDPMFAPRAVHLASLIGGDGAVAYCATLPAARTRSCACRPPQSRGICQGKKQKTFSPTHWTIPIPAYAISPSSRSKRWRRCRRRFKRKSRRCRRPTRSSSSGKFQATC
jgi:hypothetical protein